MTADARDYMLEISELLFRLTTESLRLRSNETRSYESLSNLTLYLASANRDMAAHDTDVLRQHLKLIPAAGDICISLSLPPSCVDRLEAMRTGLEPRIGHALASEAVLSLLLFDYVVEQKAARVLETLGFGACDGLEHRGGDALFSH
ncbi:hypothetical protein [Sphingopyxis macrogoltabida]|uniref:Uncharacterized protein n=2 Tax=Sphingopyxis macrogoltabida TaxID=33050 RepID=A0AAC9FHN4_SPHMC|nr:hypothetical protein [Sphingopyxis macrogoltabida]AMU92510.1 hypothetical protein ATM17_30085 [Sphingopyxis macrogoltabida]